MHEFYAKEVSLYLHKPVGSHGDLIVNKIISVILTVGAYFKLGLQTGEL